MMSNRTLHSFFSRDNIERAVWSAIVLVIFGFGLNHLFDRLSPPPPLVVTVTEPAIVTANVLALTEEIKRMRATFGHQGQDPAPSKASASASSRTQPRATATDLEAATRSVNALEKKSQRMIAQMRAAAL
jgi:hypothetical protein